MIAKTINDALISNGISKRKMSIDLGIHYMSLCYFLKEDSPKKNIDIWKIERIFHYLGISFCDKKNIQRVLIEFERDIKRVQPGRIEHSKAQLLSNINYLKHKLL